MTDKPNSPCPFCGGQVDPEGWLRGDGVRGPECESCGATAPTLAVWNSALQVDQPAEQPAYTEYVTQPGESLAGIAARQLKDKSRWVEIRDLNAHAFPDMDPHDYYPVGTALRLPAVDRGQS